MARESRLESNFRSVFCVPTPSPPPAKKKPSQNHLQKKPLCFFGFLWGTVSVNAFFQKGFLKIKKGKKIIL
jgi:hypothetical protein